MPAGVWLKKRSNTRAGMSMAGTLLIPIFWCSSMIFLGVILKATVSRRLLAILVSPPKIVPIWRGLISQPHSKRTRSSCTDTTWMIPARRSPCFVCSATPGFCRAGFSPIHSKTVSFAVTPPVSIRSFCANTCIAAMPFLPVLRRLHRSRVVIRSRRFPGSSRGSGRYA